MSDPYDGQSSTQDVPGVSGTNTAEGDGVFGFMKRVWTREEVRGAQSQEATGPFTSGALELNALYKSPDR